MHKRKLIEVALPLEAINRESAREKTRKVGKPQQIHHWWARRPITAARAMIFAQMVDDPSSRPDQFPSEKSQRVERERLHGLITRLSTWEALNDQTLLAEAFAEIEASAGGKVPPLLDPFAGGGTIPLESQRLGLETVASDLNPVAVLINKALIEIPPRFLDTPPIFPGRSESEFRTWRGSAGLAADVRAYGDWMRTEAERRLGDIYPDIDGMPVISWLWARTVTCPNPGCRIDAPLIRSWWLAKKKGKETYLVPEVVDDPTHPSGLKVRFSIRRGRPAPGGQDGTVSGRTGAICIACGTAMPVDYLRAEGQAKRVGAVMTTVVAEGNRQRVYVEPPEEHVQAAAVERPDDPVHGEMADNPRWFSPPSYGMANFADLFTNRQLTVLTTLSDLVREVRARVVSDGGSSAYADAVVTYLGLAVSRLTDWSGNLCRWESNAEVSQQVFGQQSVNMTWDFSEPRALGERASGSLGACLTTLLRSLEQLSAPAPGRAEQADAMSRSFDGYVINTDPPYYDNIGYSDLSDYFYVWLRRSLRGVYPELLSTMLVPKAEELVANPYRHGGKDGAKEFFEGGFQQVFRNARDVASSDYPLAVYYAFKQSESDDGGEASTGWETLLEGMIRGGWEITATWPIRSEGTARLIAQNTNALASSIVLALRPRSADAGTTDRRGFIAALESELPSALRRLEQGEIAPVDLPQSAIGPGMAVFSRYSAVLEPDGKKMTVRAALSRINEILDQVLNEQEGDFDPTSRFAVAWYRQYGYGVGKFGDADNLARARNTSVAAMDRDEILTSRAGNVQLIKPSDLSWDYDVVKDAHTSNWEALHHLIKALERDGIAPAGDFLQAALSRPDGAIDADLMKELAHLLFRIAEGNGWTKDALSFNTLVTSWPEILEVARTVKKPAASQGALDFDEKDD
ncbi:DUF1156 domain-containing protein [Rhodococcus hoagii]|nr:DUF1156 domain-containing protein [Prescottella equi]MBM4528842.1 DUF1156 domain-containing protein [Prescottella equi]MBM4545460.1 DUF1156 domain-containing protein [Prescottella equi]MBM4572229.1 DUF1156 domain-containing protein [Prescottella equi]MBM4607489.1 DUF1156 domain-containing protein [Prescottella equi]